MVVRGQFVRAAVLCTLWASVVEAQWGGPTKVTVAKAELRSLPATSMLVGTVEPLRRSLIGAEIAGLVAAMPVRQGDFVQEGELICKLRDQTERLLLAEARERLKSLEAIAAKWDFEQKRVATLYERQDAADKEVYDTNAEYDQARFAVSAQQIVVARLEAELAKTEIRAPFPGYVVARHAEVGQWLTMGGDVVALSDLSSVLVRVDVPEDAIAYTRPGNPATVFVEGAGQRFPSTVRHVMLQADPTARTFPVEIEVKNPWYVEIQGQRLPRSVARREGLGIPQNQAGEKGIDSLLLAGGMFARVTLQTGPDHETLAVPKDSVSTRDGIEYVAMVVPGQEEGSFTAIPTKVTTGVDMDDWISITSGNIAPGSTVVTSGNENIMFPCPVVILTNPDHRPEQAIASELAEAAPQTGS